MKPHSFLLGVAYYPEHVAPERWEYDLQLMRKAGINTLRLAEFAWGALEPAPDQYHFDWLDRVLELAHRYDIAVVLGTPTASPPPWVMAHLPDAFIVRADGTQELYGQRRAYCPSHRGYRERARRVVQAMAAHYETHPAVIGWQIDNEFGARCYCATCKTAFEDWLRARYTTLEALNQAWGTVFWSHRYSDWNQIPLPQVPLPNPGLALDFRRFVSDTYAAFQREQIAIIRDRCPGQIITHNCMGYDSEELDYATLVKDLDVVGLDCYPGPVRWPLSAVANAHNHDAMRGLKKSTFWVLEEQSGAPGSDVIGELPQPGDMRLWTYQSVAHGADAIFYFCWRTARYGAEQYWHGLLDHHGRPGRRYDELRQVGDELGRIGALLIGTQPVAPVAMLHCYDSRFAFQIQPNYIDDDPYAPNKRIPGPTALFKRYYQAFFQQQIGVDLIPPGYDLASYQLVVAPALHVLESTTVEQLTQFVAAGGMLIVTARSGVKDRANAVVDQPLPGLLATLCGVEVEEYAALAPGQTIPLQWEGHPLSAEVVHAQAWADLLTPTDAQVLATYDGAFYRGSAAVTVRRAGKGRVIYVGTTSNGVLERALVGWCLDELGLQAPLAVPPGVEVCKRMNASGELVLVLNHTSEPQSIILPEPMTELLGGRLCSDELLLEPKGVAVFQRAPHTRSAEQQC